MGVAVLNNYGLETKTVDIDFSAEATKDVTINLDEKTIKDVIRGRLYIDTDPGAAFSELATFTFYSKAAKKGEDAIFRATAKLVYTELEVATTGSDANITPDDETDFSPNDLSLILDTTDEYARLKTIADTMVAEDNPAAHPINSGLVRVSEFFGFSLVNLESSDDVYLRILFPSAQTVSLKMNLVLQYRS